MPATIMQLSFRFDVSKEDCISAVSPLAEQCVALPGMLWSIWLINSDQTEASGIYLFDDRRHAQDFLESDLTTSLTNHPAFRDFRIKMFRVMPSQTLATRGPMHAITQYRSRS